MPDKTATAYRIAEGHCLDAMVSLRRFAGTDAIDSLRAAISTVEQERARARAADRLRVGGGALLDGREHREMPA